MVRSASYGWTANWPQGDNRLTHIVNIIYLYFFSFLLTFKLTKLTKIKIYKSPKRVDSIKFILFCVIFSCLLVSVSWLCKFTPVHKLLTCRGWHSTLDSSKVHCAWACDGKFHKYSYASFQKKLKEFLLNSNLIFPSSFVTIIFVRPCTTSAGPHCHIRLAYF